MAKLIVAEAAEAEYAAAAEWYAERSHAAADGFTEAVAAAFRRILDRPEWGAACDALHRQVIVRGYPYQDRLPHHGRWRDSRRCDSALQPQA